jgi:NAD-dependent deacetylase
MGRYPMILIARLRDARHVVVLTGAGVSAESGLPTFRDPLTGLWARYRPEELATPEAFARDPETVWAWYGSRREAARRAEPNPAHRAIARLASKTRLTLITQNVDGLHRRAGSADPIELHGSLFRSRCAKEGSEHEDLVDSALGAGRLPRCPDCNALLRPGVVWFGESLPEEALERARVAAVTCDVFLSVGTSHQVYPAAALPSMAAGAGAAVVVVDPSREASGGLPGATALVGKAGEILPGLLQEVWPEG